MIIYRNQELLFIFVFIFLGNVCGVLFLSAANGIFKRSETSKRGNLKQQRCFTFSLEKGAPLHVQLNLREVSSNKKHYRFSTKYRNPATLITGASIPLFSTSHNLLQNYYDSTTRYDSRAQ